MGHTHNLIFEIVKQQGPITATVIAGQVAVGLSRVQVVLAELVNNGLIGKAGTIKEGNGRGGPRALYRELKGDDIVDDLGYMQNSVHINTPLSMDKDQGLLRAAVSFRDRKIDIIKKAIKQPNIGEIERDLWIGILSDYGVKHDG